MKTRAKMKHLLLGAVLLSGLMYSVLALNVTPVYAASCDCTIDKAEAEYWCRVHTTLDLLSSWYCPPQGPAYFWTCQGGLGSQHQLCSD
jgi:hypothetical protein